jgi:hypothetical protein
MCIYFLIMNTKMSKCEMRVCACMCMYVYVFYRTKLLYLPAPAPVVYIVPLSHILGRLPLLPAGDYGTIPRSMSHRKDACFPRGICDRQGQPGSGSPLYYINTWAMTWPTDYPAVAGAEV